MEPLLKGTGLKKRYAGPKPLEVLRGVDLEVGAGEWVGIIGPSGSGKSTLLHLLAGLDRPTSGEVKFQGKSLYRLQDAEVSRIRNAAFGFVFQFYYLVPELTALENVMLPCWMQGFSGSGNGEKSRSLKGLKAAALELLKAVGLENRVDHRPSELSGGEQQRCAIARALINRPKLVFCDEPTGNLDAKSGEEILRLLMKFNRQEQMSFVMVTHEPSILKMAGRVLSLKDGQLWA